MIIFSVQFHFVLLLLIVLTRDWQPFGSIVTEFDLTTVKLKHYKQFRESSLDFRILSYYFNVQVPWPSHCQ